MIETVEKPTEAWVSAAVSHAKDYPERWAVDASNANTVPWFGWRTADKVANALNVNNTDDIQTYVGRLTAQKGLKFPQSEKGLNPAVLNNTPRVSFVLPLVGQSRVATFITFAYNFANSIWLGVFR
ncbi:uncharacterized protein BCR38DRAFT_411796 [Pseudomassariella vexata]|uniref:Uncharacterized protein n=1 Tax=Pseudomassariella vexata TaxID=1141098 RepID=A0A1Y2DMY7_9PEZI|nr:uncharacterized protein BCR38DRAFT_411796 [Pseudomassariella vexata]ORY60658.1 hypothetical protein BCR38DRAFT_411796 [Pseudomassariella vexata]